MQGTRWLRWGDILPVAVCLLAAALLWCVSVSGGEGAAVRVITPDGEQVFLLSADTVQTVQGAHGLSLTFVIKDDGVAVEAADCSDQVCVHAGRLTKNGQTAACLPAGVILAVESVAEDAAPDAVAR